jgi:hypothetical protein
MPGNITPSTQVGGDTTDTYTPPGVATPVNANSGIAGLVSGSGNIPSISGSLGSAGTVMEGSTFQMTDGWYITIACVFGIVTADTKIGPLVLGILTVGLIYQLTLLVQGK